ncbi:MAG TPA: hypothetical protein VHM90_08190 [Phycisphaerae bacterium]|nr:hypothetical protein [Phycisphaerae bacterium]
MATLRQTPLDQHDRDENSATLAAAHSRLAKTKLQNPLTFLIFVMAAIATAGGIVTFSSNAELAALWAVNILLAGILHRLYRRDEHVKAKIAVQIAQSRIELNFKLTPNRE